MPVNDRPYVLVVDDNPTNLELALCTLELDDIEAGAAADGAEMTQAMAVRRPDLILMDVQLPGTDGLELTRRLKADPATAAIPVVALTAFAMKGDAERIRAAGCDGYLSKPIDVASFATSVRSHLPR